MSVYSSFQGSFLILLISGRYLRTGKTKSPFFSAESDYRTSNPPGNNISLNRSGRCSCSLNREMPGILRHPVKKIFTPLYKRVIVKKRRN